MSSESESPGSGLSYKVNHPQPRDGNHQLERPQLASEEKHQSGWRSSVLRVKQQNSAAIKTEPEGHVRPMQHRLTKHTRFAAVSLRFASKSPCTLTRLPLAVAEPALALSSTEASGESESKPRLAPRPNFRRLPLAPARPSSSSPLPAPNDVYQRVQVANQP